MSDGRDENLLTVPEDTNKREESKKEESVNAASEISQLMVEGLWQVCMDKPPRRIKTVEGIIGVNVLVESGELDKSKATLDRLGISYAEYTKAHHLFGWLEILSTDQVMGLILREKWNEMASKKELFTKQIFQLDGLTKTIKDSRDNKLLAWSEADLAVQDKLVESYEKKIKEVIEQQKELSLRVSRLQNFYLISEMPNCYVRHVELMNKTLILNLVGEVIVKARSSIFSSNPFDETLIALRSQFPGLKITKIRKIHLSKEARPLFQPDLPNLIFLIKLIDNLMATKVDIQDISLTLDQEKAAGDKELSEEKGTSFNDENLLMKVLMKLHDKIRDRDMFNAASLPLIEMKFITERLPAKYYSDTLGKLYKLIVPIIDSEFYKTNINIQSGLIKLRDTIRTVANKAGQIDNLESWLQVQGQHRRSGAFGGNMLESSIVYR